MKKRPADLSSLRLARSRLRAALRHFSDAMQLEGWSKAQHQVMSNWLSVGWRMDAALTERCGAGSMRGGGK